ncbi:hypothetical protein Q3G72_035371 [Acer saccharum]|nr:hypothetical protein Q3G72_035371 [Acer saccharum]
MDFAYGPWLQASGVPGQHRGSNLPYDNGGELHQKDRRRYRNGREGLSFEHSVGGKGSRPNTDSVMHQRPLSECTETALQPPSGRQVGATVEAGQTSGTLVGTQVCSVSILATRDTVFGGTSAGRGEDNRVSCEAGLCPPLKLSDVVVEADFRFTSGEVVHDNSGGSKVVGKGESEASTPMSEFVVDLHKLSTNLSRISKMSCSYTRAKTDSVRDAKIDHDFDR